MTLQFGNVSFSAGGRVKPEVPGKKPVQAILNPQILKLQPGIIIKILKKNGLTLAKNVKNERLKLQTFRSKIYDLLQRWNKNVIYRFSQA